MNGLPDPAPDTGSFDRRQAAWLVLLTLAGAALRLALAWDRPRLGDEVGTLLSLRLDAGYLLTHFSGWLTMNYFILAEKAVAQLTGSEGWPLEILPMLGGIATIPLTASLARRLGGGRLALVAAALTAFNPYLVRYSPVLRAYAPLAALAIWAVDLFFRWRERRTWRAGVAVAGVIFLLLLMHPNGIYVVMGLGVLVVIEAAGMLARAPSAARRVYAAGLLTFLLPLAGAGLATWLAYRRLAPDVRAFSVKWSAAPPTSLEYLPGVFATYFGSGFPLFLPAGLLLAGVWSTTQTRKTLLPLCLLVGLSPVFVSLKGVSHFPWAYARFQIYCVPMMLILMAEGIRWLTAQISGRRVIGMVIPCVLTLITAVAWIPPVVDLFVGKRENAAYADTASYLRAQRRPGDLIVIEGAPHLQMTPMLPQGADAPVRAEDFVKRPGGVGEGGRVLFVAPDEPPLGTTGTRRVLGKLQVVEYPGPASVVCSSLRADLARAADGRIDPGLGDSYALLALLDEGQPTVPDAPSVREWSLLARLCRAQTARFRSLPEQMRVREGRPDNQIARGKSEPVTPSPHPRRHDEAETEN